jgi:predicted HicB family RNase H-like nuclease
MAVDKESKNNLGRVNRSRTEVRFANEEHRLLVAEAARKNGLSMNAWIVMTTLAAARREVGKA